MTPVQLAQIALGKAFHAMALAEAEAQPYLATVNACRDQVNAALQVLEELRAAEAVAETEAE